MSNVTLFVVANSAMAVLLAVHVWQGMTLTELDGAAGVAVLTVTTRVLFAVGSVTSRLIPVLMALGPVLLTMLAVGNRSLTRRPGASRVWRWVLVVVCALVAQIALASVVQGAWWGYGLLLLTWAAYGASGIALAESSHLQGLRHRSGRSRWSPVVLLVVGIVATFATPLLGAGVALFPYVRSQQESEILQAG